MELRTLNIDGGTRKIGANIMELQGRQIRRVESWQIPLIGKEMWDRLYYLGVKLEDIIINYIGLHSISAEATFITNATTKNSDGETTYKYSKDSPLALSMARGVIYYVAGKHGIPVYEYSPTTCKKLLTGNANASKNMIMKAAAQKFNGVFEEDESCSLAVGNAHLLTLLHNEKKKSKP